MNPRIESRLLPDKQTRQTDREPASQPASHHLIDTPTFRSCSVQSPARDRCCCRPSSVLTCEIGPCRHTDKITPYPSRTLRQEQIRLNNPVPKIATHSACDKTRHDKRTPKYRSNLTLLTVFSILPPQDNRLHVPLSLTPWRTISRISPPYPDLQSA